MAKLNILIKKTINKFPKDELERLLDNFKDKPLFPDNKNFIKDLAKKIF